MARCAAHPLGRALRPGGLVLAALQDVALTYLRRDVVATIPFWRQAAAPVDELRRRAEAIVVAAGRGEAVATEAVPGAGSAPGTTIASFGIRLAGDHVGALRAANPPVIARARDGGTWLDLRTVDPTDDAVLVAALASSGAQ